MKTKQLLAYSAITSLVISSIMLLTYFFLIDFEKVDDGPEVTEGDPIPYNERAQLENYTEESAQLLEKMQEKREYILLDPEDGTVQMDDSKFKELKTCPCNRKLRLYKGVGDVDPQGEGRDGQAMARPQGGLFHYNYPINTTDINKLIRDKDYPKLFSQPPSNSCPKIPPKNKQSNKKITIALIDSGVDHPDLMQYMYRHRPGDKPECFKYNFATEDTALEFNFNDQLGHGTHIAGILTQERPGVPADRRINELDLTIVPLKIFGDEDSGDLFDAVCAIYTAIELHTERVQRIDIINLSWGFNAIGNDTIHRPKILHQALLKAMENRIAVVCSAGNNFDPDETPYNNDIIPNYPSNLYTEHDFNRGLLAVGSFELENYTYSYANYANYGRNSVTLAEDGTNILSTISPGGCGLASGTSMAAGIASRELALKMAGSQCYNDLSCLNSGICHTQYMTERGFRCTAFQ